MVVFCIIGEQKHFLSSLQVSLASLIINMIDNINERKTNKTLTSYIISRIHGRDPGKLKNSQKCLNQHLKSHLRLKRKDDVEDGKSVMSEKA